MTLLLRSFPIHQRNMKKQRTKFWFVDKTEMNRTMAMPSCWLGTCWLHPKIQAQKLKLFSLKSSHLFQDRQKLLRSGARLAWASRRKKEQAKDTFQKCSGKRVMEQFQEWAWKSTRMLTLPATSPVTWPGHSQTLRSGLHCL